MKRTELRRRTPLERGPGPQRSRKPLKQTRGRKCYAHLRDPEYRAWVRAQGCILASPEWNPAGYRLHKCGGRVEFSHVVPEGRGGPDYANGKGLCTLAHTDARWSWHRGGRKSFEARFGIDASLIAIELAIRYQKVQRARLDASWEELGLD